VHPFKKHMLAKAIEVQSVLTGDCEQIREMVAENELVLAIWQDERQSDGFGFLVLKGERLLASVANSKQANAAAWTVIPCLDAEQALAQKKRLEQ
jgi:hypothetical protein